MIDPLNYKPKGDKENSTYFNNYREKIYQRRIDSGLNDLLGHMAAIVVQVQTGDGLSYLKELYVMTPYRFQAGFISQTHRIYILKNCIEAPAFIVMEPLNPNFEDGITRINRLYPNSREKFNARYVGEIFHCQNLKETKSILEEQSFNFYHPDNTENKLYCGQDFSFTRMSDHSFNSVGYTENDFSDLNSLNLGQKFCLRTDELQSLNDIDNFTLDQGIKPLLKGIDHMATRILAGDREDALLEFMCLSNYYFWGAYNISAMNSSTNVNRTPDGNDIKSPAKVFTANNTPFMVNSFEKLPMPTENFVRNYGRRMHHIAIEVADGDHNSQMKNLDFVIDTLKHEAHIGFLAKVFGECKDEPNLKQIFSKHSSLSLLITEYVERCHNFDGFFTKDNVAALTAAAGLDEEIHEHHQQKGIIAD